MNMKKLATLAAFLLAINVTWLFGQVEMDFGWTPLTSTNSSQTFVNCDGSPSTVTLTTPSGFLYKRNGSSIGSYLPDAAIVPWPTTNGITTATITLTFSYPVRDLKLIIRDIDDDGGSSGYEEWFTDFEVNGFVVAPPAYNTLSGGFMSNLLKIWPTAEDSEIELNFAAHQQVTSVSFDYHRFNDDYAIILDSMSFDCSCSARFDSEYERIHVPTTYNIANASGGVINWPSKVYVDQDVTVDGVTLDVTGSDVVFDQCRRITLINGAQLRANNSTFRPCNPNDSWEGIYFTSDGTLHSSAVVNECVFKNAVDALRFESSTIEDNIAHYDARITNNNFVNCLKGVYVTGSGYKIFHEGITGNTFTVDNRNINWQLRGIDGGCSPLTVYGFRGISASSTMFDAQISQNDFINTSDLNSPDLIGVLWNNCQGSVTLNNFTNNQRAVQLNDCNTVFVENNEIELTFWYPSYMSQIMAQRSEAVWITGNHLTNGNEMEDYTPNGAAIGLEYCLVGNVKENHISGFSNGIQLFETSHSSINENVLKNCNIVGIVVDGGERDSVTCNQIKMRLRSNSSPLNEGIFYNHTIEGEDPTISIKGNCVTDATMGIVVQNQTSSIQRVPRIHNNYLYNYTIYGVYSIDFAGDQGSGIATADEAARNTFASNNIANGAVDIETLGLSQNWFGNYGVYMVSPGVSLFGGNHYSSIASCGLQIAGPNSSIGDGEICDMVTIVWERGFGRLRQGDFQEFEQGRYGNGETGMEIVMLQNLVKSNELTAAANFMAWIEGSSRYSHVEKTWIEYNYLQATDKEDDALDMLSTLEALDPGYGDFARIMRLRYQVKHEGRTFSSLTHQEISVLEEIDNARGRWSDDARDLLHIGYGNYPHILKPIPSISLQQSAASRSLDATIETLTIFPNPAESQVTIEYVVKNTENGWLQVLDATGRLIHREELKGEVSNTKLDVSQYPAGIYVVSLVTADGFVKTGKLQVR